MLTLRTGGAYWHEATTNLPTAYAAIKPATHGPTVTAETDRGHRRSADIVWLVVTARRYTSAVYPAVVCPSVRPSVTSRYCIKTAKRRITETAPFNSQATLLFWRQRPQRNSNWSPQRGVKYRRGSLKSEIFDQYLSISQKRCKTGTIYSY